MAPGCLQDFDQCVLMTDAVLGHGCDIQDTIGYSAKASALFEVCYYWPMEKAPPSMPAKALQYLIDKGYDIEQLNQEGQTPLLWTASAYQPQVIKCLRIFIKRKANLYARDGEGRGALHCALLAPHILDGWKSQHLVSQDVHVSRSYHFARQAYDTEDSRHIEDYVHENLTDLRWEDECLSANVTGQITLAGPQMSAEFHSHLESIDQNSYAAYQTHIDDIQLDEPNANEYVLCKDFDGNETRIQNPIRVLKKRLMFKLLTVLKAGCDPNCVDNAGLSPSDYARRDGLWAQWFWALENSGYAYNVRTDRWSKMDTI